MKFIKLYLITLPIFFIIDILWIGLVAKDFYQKQIGFLMKTNINWIAAILFYLLFIAGLIIFVISPALEKKMWLNAFLFGAFFGLIAYATYDLTNLSTLKDWPILITIVDLIWGMSLSAILSVISYFIAVKIGL